MRRDWTTLKCLFLMLLVLVLVSCSANDPLGDADYPCGPSFSFDPVYNDSLVFNANFLKWTPDGNMLVFRGPTALGVVDAVGTRLELLADVNPGNRFLYGFSADISPDGSQVIYSSCEFPTGEGRWGPEREHYDYEIVAINLDGTDKRRLTQNIYTDHFPVWSPDGSHIAFIANPRRGNAELYMMAADGSNVRLVATTLIKSVTEFSGERWATNAQATRWKRIDGEEVADVEGAWLGALALAPPLWSPDGMRLAFLVEEGEYWPLQKILYTVRADGTEMRRLAAVESVPAWSPDGDRIAVAKYAGDDLALFTLGADGSNPKQITKITDRETFENRHSRYQLVVVTVSWSPDGSKLLYTCDTGVCVVGVEDRLVIELTEGDEEIILAAWSPDGNRIAIYTQGDFYGGHPIQVYTVTSNGTDRRDLIHLDADGNLLPVNPPQEGS